MMVPCKERPILFTGAMIRALLDGRKSQTRRVVKPQPDESWPDRIECGWYSPTVIRRGQEEPGPKVFGFANEDQGWVCPFGGPGDRLWVRETFAVSRAYDHCSASSPHIHNVGYRAGGGFDFENGLERGRWRPSIFMPRWASRIALEVTGVRVERVQEISETDAMAEGIFEAGNLGFFMYQGAPGPHCRDSARETYACLWDSINAKHGYGWDSNPFVWVVEAPMNAEIACSKAPTVIFRNSLCNQCPAGVGPFFASACGTGPVSF